VGSAERMAAAALTEERARRGRLEQQAHAEQLRLLRERDPDLGADLAADLQQQLLTATEEPAPPPPSMGLRSHTGAPPPPPRVGARRRGIGSGCGCGWQRRNAGTPRPPPPDLDSRGS